MPAKDELKRAEIARLGGLATKGRSSEAKSKAAKANGSKGGRPRKYATASERQRAYLLRKNLPRKIDPEK